MKKEYSRKIIENTIRHWERKLNEAIDQKTIDLYLDTIMPIVIQDENLPNWWKTPQLQTQLIYYIDKDYDYQRLARMLGEDYGEFLKAEEKYICGHHDGGLFRWAFYQLRPGQFPTYDTKLGTIESRYLQPLADFMWKDVLEFVGKQFDEGADMHIILRGLYTCRLAFTDKNAEEVA